jgi:NAD(P)H dehydrogenase (quinone)
MKKIFITTSAGNIGTELVKELNNKKIDFSAGHYQNKPAGFGNTLHIDFNDYDSLQKAFKGHEVLYLLLPDNEKVIEWARKSIEAAKKSGIKHIVRSSGINADSKSTYEVFRVLGVIEDLVKESGIDFTFVRPNSFFQNFVTYHSYSIKSGALYLPQGTGRVSYVDVRDVARCAATILTDPSEHVSKTYTITGEAAYGTDEIVGLISSATGRAVTYQSIADSNYVETMQKYQLPKFNIDSLLSLYQADKKGVNSIITQTVTELTGKKPKSFQEFIIEYKNWLT